MKTTKQSLTRSFLHAGLALALLAAATAASAITNIWTGAISTNWNTAGNWSPSGVPVSTNDVVFDGTGINVGSIGLTAQSPLKSLTFTAGQTTPVNFYTTAGSAFFTNNTSGGSITVAAGSGAHKIVGTGTGSSGTSADFLIQGGVTSFIFNIGSGATFEINGRIRGGSLSAVYTKTNTGTLILSGNNGGGSAWQFNSGAGFNVSQGAVRFAAGNAYGNSGNPYTVASGAAIELSGGVSQTVNNGTLTINGTGIGGAGVIRNLGGNNAISGTGTGGIILGTAPSIGADAGILTLGVVISGNGSLTKVGAGDLVLTKTNTYTGSTTISAGILNAGNLGLQNSRLDTAASIVGDASNGLKTSATSLTLGGLTGNKNLADVFTTTSGGYSGVTDLTLNPVAGVSASYSGVIADGAPGMTLTKTGAGTQVLSGISTYSGNTTINAGRLQGVVGGSLASANVILNGTAATNSVAITDNTTGWTNAAFTANTAGVLEFDFGSVAPSATVSPFIVSGAADFTAATPTVRVVVASPLEVGTYPLMTWGSISGPAPTSVSVSALQLGTVASLSVSGSTLNLVIAQAIVVKDNNSDDLNLTTSWVGGVVPGVSDLAKWDSTVTNANTTVLGADLSWAGVRITNPGGSVTINAGNTLTLGVAIDMSTATADLTLNCDVALGAANIWDVTTGRTLTAGGAVSGANPLTKQGAGTLVLAGAGVNSFAGPLTIAGGTVQLSGSADRVPTSCAVTLTNLAGATFDLNGFNQEIAALNGGGAAGGNVSLGAGNLTVSGSGSFAGVISGSGAVIKSGSGTLTLSGSNSHSGGTYFTGNGVLALANSSAAGSGMINLASTQTGTAATFTLNGGIDVTNAIQIDAATGRNTINSLGTNNNTLSGNITISNDAPNSIVFNNSAATGSGTTFTVGGATPNSTTITASSFANFISFRASNLGNYGALNSRINAPSAQFNANNNGLWTINSTGSTWVVTSFSNAGGFILGANDALATGAHLSFASSATGYLDMNGKNQTVAGLDIGNSSIAYNITNSGGNDSTLTLSGLTTNRNFNGKITDGGAGKRISLVMNDSSGFTQTLSGANTYTGNTTVSNGTLAIQVASLATNSTVSIAAGGVLQLNFFETNIVAAFVTNGVSLPAGVYNAGNVGPLLAGAGSLQVIGGSVPPTPVSLVPTFSGSTLTLTWPSGQGWKLQQQTNALSQGLSTNWVEITPDSDGSTSITVDPTKPTVFYRLAYP